MAAPPWLLGDHLGSTAYIVNGTAKTGETRYYLLDKDHFASGQTLTSYTFTVCPELAEGPTRGSRDWAARGSNPWLTSFGGSLPMGDSLFTTTRSRPMVSSKLRARKRCHGVKRWFTAASLIPIVYPI